MTNQDLASKLIAEADTATERRRELLCCAVAISTTKTIPAARKVLTEWEGPDSIRRAAIATLDALAAETA
jgi:hypothetical protein